MLQSQHLSSQKAVRQAGLVLIFCPFRLHRSISRLLATLDLCLSSPSFWEQAAVNRTDVLLAIIIVVGGFFAICIVQLAPYFR